MNRINFRNFLALLTVLTAIQPLNAAFDQFGKDARPSGMGEAFVGVADDVSALYYNPAGITQIHELTVSAQMNQIVQGLDDNSSIKTTSFGLVQPLKGGRWGTVGFSYSNYKASSLAHERLILASYARTISLSRLGLGETWSVGVNLKNMRREYEPDRFIDNALNNVGTGSGQADPLFSQNGFSRDVFAIDVGALYHFGPINKYQIGFSFTNLNQPDVSLARSDDKAPLTGRLGFAMKPSWGLLTTELRRTKRLASRMDSEIAFGAERNFPVAGLGNMALRGGYVQGSREAQAITAGLSFLLSSVQLDYGFKFPTGELTETGGTHRVGFSLRYGGAERKVQSVSNPTGKSETETSLINFSSNFRSAHFVLDRVAVAKNLTEENRNRIVNLLVKKVCE